MAREIRAFQVVVPAGTTKAAGWSQDVSFPPREVVQVEIRIPPGPRGEMGFSLGSGGVPVLPSNAGGWVVADDQDIVWPLDGQWNSGAWSVQAYNTGQYDHTIYLTFLLDLPNATTAGPAPAAAAAVSGSVLPSGSVASGTAAAPSLPAPPSVPAPPSISAAGASGTVPATAAPLILPPSLPTLPGQAAPAPTDGPSGLLLGLADQGAVLWLSGPRLFALADQPSLEGLTGAGVPAASVSDQQVLDMTGTTTTS